MKDRYDTLVIGAGPAGCASAIGLARLGKRVLLVDRDRFPRDKVCGGCLNPRSLAALRDLGVDPGGVPLKRLVLHAGGRRAHLPLYGGMAVSRRSLDAALVRAARDAGVEVREGMRIEPGDPVPAHTVIAATGLATAIPGIEYRVARRSRIGAGALIEGLGAAVEPGDLHMYCARGGYVGVVRVEDHRLDVAAAIDPELVRERGGLAQAVTGLVDDLALPIDADWRGTPLLTRTPSRLFSERTLLVGDAAGYLEPFTGEGIAWALAGARALAPLAAEWNETTGPRWEREHARLIRGTQRTCRALQRALRHPRLVAAAVSVLSRAPKLARPLIRAATLGRTA